MQVSANRAGNPGRKLLRFTRRINPDRVYAILMILPSVILLAIFVYGFIGQTLWWSLTDWAGLEKNAEKNYIKLDNYKTLFSDITGMRFRQELVNTFFFTLFFVGGCLILGFILAVVLDQNVKGEGLFRTVFLFPMALSFAVTGTIWRWLLNPGGGINALPKMLGADAWNYRWINNRSPYTFNWHEVPHTTTLLIIAVLLFFIFRQIWRRKYLATIYLGVPMALLFLWMWSDWVSWDDTQAMHGTFNWQDVPRYVVAVIVIGFVLYMVSLLWHGKRRAALILGIPTAVVLLWYAAGGTDNFPNVEFPEAYGFNIALVGVIIAAVWQMSGYTMAMYLAGIRGVPEELREAARVDGCSEWQVYMRIVLPMLRPITLSAAIVLGHISLKIFDLIFAMAGIDHWPVSVPGVQVYYTMFRSNKFAVGSAIAIVLLIMVASVVIPYLITSLRAEHEL
jgi:glucose/mannose transport system permease protein